MACLSGVYGESGCRHTALHRTQVRLAHPVRRRNLLAQIASRKTRPYMSALSVSALPHGSAPPGEQREGIALLRILSIQTDGLTPDRCHALHEKCRGEHSSRDLIREI